MSERDRLLGHSDEADGIEEYDNPLPTWWLSLLVGSVLFAIGYAADYHYIGPTSEAAEYDAELAAAPNSGPVVVTITADTVREGGEVFAATCVACHGADLHGGIGPNLTDATWVHGGKLDDIVKTVTRGVPEKGMPSWGPILGPRKIAQVAAYVHEQGGGQ